MPPRISERHASGHNSSSAFPYAASIPSRNRTSATNPRSRPICGGLKLKANLAPPELIRDPRGYHKHGNGLLNVEPIGNEVAIGAENAKNSPLLCLPPEVRNMIWSFTLGDSPVKVIYKHSSNMPGLVQRRRFDLLRVSRQVYAETALLPYILSAFDFFKISQDATFLNQELLQHIEILHFSLTMTRRPVEYGIYRSLDIKFPALKSAIVKLSQPSSGTAREKEEELWENLFPGKQIEFRFAVPRTSISR